ncbi:HAL/PAL/TAL family ammonia-lyase [Sporolactobacillus terrae]|uniref:HAL/PAL/TAL family ammonia-lyase n=1 Tax=Sporolactobacillus terrae TaxID=269673 RepID=UPI00048E2C64|nr:aromatic amino acid ammonia-lyase [Sporolactobacillus terrae]
MNNQHVMIDGQHLSIDQVIQVAVKKSEVTITDAAWKKVVDSRRFVEQQMDSENPVYGMNRGVGLNKDRKVDPAHFEGFNRNLILSHCISIDPESSIETVRAAMLIRLNIMLLGFTGVQPQIVRMYQQFLNKHLCPVIHERGSIGAADIGCLSAIGLAMIGEGEVYFNDECMSAREALRLSGLEPVKLGPKDGLAIVSSNALFVGKTVLLIHELERFLKQADLVYALSLEGFDGNVTPLHSHVIQAKKLNGQKVSAKLICDYLENSYLWNGHQRRNLQDPLSYRGAFSVHGSVRDALDYVKGQVRLYLNASEDNPAVLPEERQIISCANYEITSLVQGVEMLNISLSHMARIACFRMIKLANPTFTGLTRFLTPRNQDVLGFATIQKAFAALDAEIQDLCQPVSPHFFSLAGDIEDHATNSIYAVQKSKKIIENLYYIFGMEAMHAAQAIDLRGSIVLGEGTKQAYSRIRQCVPFLNEDRNLSLDMQQMYTLLQESKLLINVMKADV